jgi:excisionase family DNA binding protein
VTIEEAIAAAVAAQVRPVQVELARVARELADLRRALPPSLVTLQDAASRLGVSLSTIRRKVAAGEIPSIRVGRSVRLDLGALRPLDVDEVAQLARAAREDRPARDVDLRNT